jgi:hypothetical protein
MIYLKKHNLLFVKPLKTASTSVEIALSCNATPEDIVTPISLNYELLRLEKKGQLPVNYAANKRDETRYAAKIRMLARLHARFPAVDLERLAEWIKLFYGKSGQRIFFNHIKPQEIMRRQSETFFKESFVVTMCRHPYEVLLSRVYWERWKKQHESEFNVEQAVDAMLANEPLNLDYYFCGDQYLPNFVVRYEQLQQDLAELEKRFGLDLCNNLPLTKKKTGQPKPPAAEVLTARQKTICYEKNRLIFEKFGYAR